MHLNETFEHTSIKLLKRHSDLAVESVEVDNPELLACHHRRFSSSQFFFNHPIARLGKRLEAATLEYQ